MNDLTENSSNLVLAVHTFYALNSDNDRLRSALALESLRKASIAGYKVFCVDGGSSGEFLSRIPQIGNVKIFNQKKKGIGWSKREAVEYSFNLSKALVICQFDLEKPSLVDNLGNLVKPIISRNAEIVIPKRSSMQSYPIEQRLTETMGNRYFASLTGKEIDIFFGPKLWHRNFTPVILDERTIDENERYDYLYLPFLEAIIQERKIESVSVDYEHSLKQTKFETMNSKEFSEKRIKQLFNITQALGKYWTERHKR